MQLGGLILALATFLVAGLVAAFLEEAVLTLTTLDVSSLLATLFLELALPAIFLRTALTLCSITALDG